MKGQVLDYSVQANSGVISGADGSRYSFVGSEWKGDVTPSRGMSVDFDVQGNIAVAVFRAVGSSGSSESKSKVTAGLLAIFLGWLGLHKFYLGYTGPGLVFLLVNTVGLLVTWFMAFIPNIVFYAIALIEGIVYLTKSDEEFEQTYVVGKKRWF